jgi:threonine/homoserine/homoserine lactone efflux protein
MLSVAIRYVSSQHAEKQEYLRLAQLFQEPATDMEYSQNLWIFATLLFGIIVVPGMDMIFVLGNALAGGARAGLAAILGIMGGGIVHTIIGTLGVTVLTVLIPQLFLPMLLLGAAYMTWVGIGLIRSSIIVDRVEGATAPSQFTTFWRGFLTCMLNPKAWLFILAVYPQFMKPQYGPIAQQAVVMGLMTIVVQFLIYGAIALGASRVRVLLTGNATATVMVGRAAGALIVLAALFTAWRGWIEMSA